MGECNLMWILWISLIELKGLFCLYVHITAWNCSLVNCFRMAIINILYVKGAQ